MATQSDLNCAKRALDILGAESITALTDLNIRAKAANANVDECKLHLLRQHTWNFAIKRAKLELVTITGCADNGSGLIQVTAPSHGFSNGQKVTITGVVGTSEANATWDTISGVTANTFDCDGSTFTNTYTSGGLCGRTPAYRYTWMFTPPSDMLRLVGVNDDDLMPEWVLEDGFILTDEQPLDVRYVADVTDYTKMDASFYEALCYYLAYTISNRLSLSNTLRNSLREDVFGVAGRPGIISKAKFADATEDSVRKLEASEWINNRASSNLGYVRDPQT